MKRRLFSLLLCSTLLTSSFSTAYAENLILPVEDNTEAEYIDNSEDDSEEVSEEVITETYNAPMVRASSTNNYVPELNVYQSGSSPKVEIGIDMASSDVKGTFGFETSGYRLTYGGSNTIGNQSVQSSVKYSGNSAIMLQDTISTHGGNQYELSRGQSSSTSSVFYPGAKIYPNNGGWLSVTYKVKNSGTSGNVYAAFQASEKVYKGRPWSDIKYAERVDWNNPPLTIRVTGGSSVGDGASNIIATATGLDPGFVAYYKFDKANSRLVYFNARNATPIVSGRKGTINVGSNVEVQTWPGGSASRNIGNVTSWTTKSCNFQLPNDTSYYDFQRDGASMYFSWCTNGTAYIDDIKYGFASKAEVMRDNSTLVYSDYGSEFVDSGVVVKPNNPTVTSAITDNTGVHFNFNATNKTETHSYKSRSLGSSGNNPSNWSSAYNVSLTSTVRGYAVCVDTNASTDPGNTVNNTTGKIDVTGYDEGTRVYCHVKTIDTNGKVSSVVHHPYTVLQTPASLRRAVDNYVNNISLVNSMNTATIKSDLTNLKTNSRLTYSVGNFTKVDATAKNNGSLTGSITINSATPNVNINKVIPARPVYQTAGELMSDIDDYNEEALDYVDNNFDVPNYREGVERQRTNPDRVLDINRLQLNKATEFMNGYLDGSIHIEACDYVIFRPITRSLEQQTLDSAVTTTSSVTLSYHATNNSTEEELLQDLKKLLNTRKYDVSIQDWQSNAATDSSTGSITCDIYIKDKNTGEERVCHLNKEIGLVHQQLSSVYSCYANNLSKYTASNLTTIDDILGLATITNPDIHARIIDYDLQEATETTRGKVTGTLVISDNINEINIPIDLTIDYVQQSIETVRSLYDNALCNFIPTNSTVELDILKLAKIFNKDIRAEISDWDLVTSTDTQDGLLTFNLNIINDYTGEACSTPITMAVPSMQDELATSVRSVQDYLRNYTVTNNTDINRLLVSINNSINTYGTFAYYDYKDKSPKLKKSTETTEGSLKGSVYVTRGNEKVEVPMNFTIRKLPRSMSNAKVIVEEALRNYHYSNSTTRENIISYVETALCDNNFRVGVMDFDKVEGNVDSPGYIKCRVTLTSPTDVDSVLVDEVLNAGVYNLNDAEIYLNERLNTLYVYNDMTQNDLTAQCRELLSSTGSNINTYISDFSIVNSTEDVDGYVNATITLYDTQGQYRTIPVMLTISSTNSNLMPVVYTTNSVLNSMSENGSISDNGLSNTLSLRASRLNRRASVDVTDWNVTEATPNKDGLVECNLRISDGEESTVIPYAYTIAKPTLNNGWNEINGNWYYALDGNACTGWLQYNDNWYYLNNEGMMLTSTYVDGYFLDSEGKCVA